MRDEWPVLRDAPWSLAAVVTASMTVGAVSSWWLACHLYVGQITNAKGEAASAKGEAASANQDRVYWHDVAEKEGLAVAERNRPSNQPPVAAMSSAGAAISVNGNGNRNYDHVRFIGWQKAVQDTGNGSRRFHQVQVEPPTQRPFRNAGAGWMAETGHDSRWVSKPVWNAVCGPRPPGASIAAPPFAMEAT